MAKKSAISGEYIVTVEDSGSIKVCKIYDNVRGSLREIAESSGMAYDSGWTTRQFGAKVIKEYGAGNMAEVGEYIVVKESSGSISTFRTYANTKGALREIAARVGFAYDSGWNTRQFGSKLVDFLNGK